MKAASDKVIVSTVPVTSLTGGLDGGRAGEASGEEEEALE